jgi:hypothetical protein
MYFATSRTVKFAEVNSLPGAQYKRVFFDKHEERISKQTRLDMRG